MNKKVGLVLEGGGFRGLYTAGILHSFATNNIMFPYTIAVSMGASNATNYLAGQTQRNLDVPYTFVNDKRYISYTRMFAKGELFGMDFIFGEVPYKLIPFDFKAFAASKNKLLYVTTDCTTGKPYYIPNDTNEESFLALEASTSLPFASKMVKMHNRLLLDGGIANPIPIEKALADGCEKVVVVLTQPKAYRKTPFKAKWLAKLMYRKFPLMAGAILNRHQVYNHQLDLIEKLEAEGKAFVVRPTEALPIGRTEKNKEKLKDAFDIGFKEGQRMNEELLEFIK
ncbi:patatin-like phospholipase family protein [Labilibacter marinus]|uniref:patatin-like phospholipase family protein n=1 Tax=Labilibacter marinus TaxID=1477105 RepID=UPI00082AE98A|nr:patatin family protein [Labilibacter marinus]